MAGWSGAGGGCEADRVRGPTPVRWFQRRLFRLGQRLLGHTGGPEGDIAAGTAVVGKDAGTTRVRVWVGTLVHGCDADTVARP